MPPITPEEEKLAEDALFGQGSGDEAGESQSWQSLGKLHST